MTTSIPEFETLPRPTAPHYRRVALAPARQLLPELLQASIIAPEDWEALPAGIQDHLEEQDDAQQLLAQLVGHKLLTQYQADRISAGKTFGLILGNYRVLDHLGTGGMGSVYKAEHFRLRRPVAVKVFAMPPARAPYCWRDFLPKCAPLPSCNIRILSARWMPARSPARIVMIPCSITSSWS